MEIYTQCEEDGNDMLLLDSFVDYRKTERALPLQYQKLTVNGKPCKKLLTAIWEICFVCKYDITTCEMLLDLME